MTDVQARVTDLHKANVRPMKNDILRLLKHKCFLNVIDTVEQIYYVYYIYMQCVYNVFPYTLYTINHWHLIESLGHSLSLLFPL